MFFKFCGLLRIYNNCISYHNHQKSHSFLSVQKIFEFWDGFRIRFVDKVLSEEAQKYLVVSNYKYQIFVAFSEYLNFNYAFLISDNSNILGTLKMKYSQDFLRRPQNMKKSPNSFRSYWVMLKTRGFLSNFKSYWEISSNFVAILEYSDNIGKII